MSDFQRHADDEALYKEVMDDFYAAEREHKRYEPGWARYHAHYRTYKDFESRVQERDRDTLQRLNRRQLDEELRIPLIFSTIETTLPRIISNLPKPTIGPRGEKTEEEVRGVRLHIEDQLSKANYDLVGQGVAKQGFSYGLGVQKTFWEKRVQNQPVIEKGDRHPWVQTEKPRVLCDDATVERVNAKDFFWDPTGYNVKTLDYAFHRFWRSTRYILAQFKAGIWKARKADGTALEGEELVKVIKGMNSGAKYSETWNEHDPEANKDASPNTNIHEVLEFHDGTRCLHLLDREIVCHPGKSKDYTGGKNPYWHKELPFQIYRPIPDLDDNKLVGVSLIEQQESLADELSTIRTERRWNAAMAVNAPFFYLEGAIDPNQIKWGPGVFNPVRGNPAELLQQFQARDVPSSGYQEEQALLADNERVTGLSEAQSGVRSSGDTTATEAQIISQSTSLTVQFRSKIFTKETMKPMLAQMVELNKQHITSERPIIRQGTPAPSQSAGAYEQVATVGPGEYSGEWDVEVDPEQIQPANGPANTERARELWQNFAGNPLIDQNMLARRVLDLYGEKKPDELVAPPEPRISPMTLQLLVDAGVPPELIDAAMNEANLAESQGRPSDPGMIEPPPPPAGGPQGPMPEGPVGPDGMPMEIGPDGMPIEPPTDPMAVIMDKLEQLDAGIEALVEAEMEKQAGPEPAMPAEESLQGEVVEPGVEPGGELVPMNGEVEPVAPPVTQDDLEQLKVGLAQVIEQIVAQAQPAEEGTEPAPPPEINLSITVNNEPGEAPTITAQTDLNAPPRTFEVERDEQGNATRYREVSQPDEAL